MTQPQIELLPCPNPACGSDNVDLMSISIGECNWTVGCNECAMTGPQAFTTVQAATGWNQYLRPSPQVAPGLRNGINYTDWLRGLPDWLESNREQSGELIFSKKVADQTIEILRAALATAQGGTVDRDTLVEYVSNLIESARMESSEPGISERACWMAVGAHDDLVELLGDIKSGRFNSAVPSAPGTERVKELWKLIEPWCTVEGNEQTVRRFDKFCAEIDALGTPQGSDSLRWTTELPDDIGSYGNAKLMWIRRFGSPSKNPVRFWRGGDARIHTDLLGYTHVAAIDDLGLTGYEFCEAIAPGWTEPAQPVDAGEAKEHGEDE